MQEGECGPAVLLKLSQQAINNKLRELSLMQQIVLRLAIH